MKERGEDKQPLRHNNIIERQWCEHEFSFPSLVSLELKLKIVTYVGKHFPRRGLKEFLRMARKYVDGKCANVAGWQKGEMMSRPWEALDANSVYVQQPREEEYLCMAVSTVYMSICLFGSVCLPQPQCQDPALQFVCICIRLHSELAGWGRGCVK